MIAAVACCAMAQDELESSGVVRLYQSRLKPNQLLIEFNFFKRRQSLMKKFQQWRMNRKADLLMLPDVTIAILIVLQLVLLVLPIITILILIIVPNVHLIQLVLPAHPDPLAQSDRFIAKLIAQLVPLVRLHTFVPPAHQLPPNHLVCILIPF